jgi:hypothetical protein
MVPQGILFRSTIVYRGALVRRRDLETSARHLAVRSDGDESEVGEPEDAAVPAVVRRPLTRGSLADLAAVGMARPFGKLSRGCSRSPPP